MSRTFCLSLLLLILGAGLSGAQNQNLFLFPPTFAGTGQPVAADLNGDGKADLVFPDGTVLLGNSDGTLHTGTSWSIAGQTLGGPIAIADCNGDGRPDLVFVVSNSVFVLLGKGDGTFQAAVSTTTGAGAGQFLVADLNGDRIPDVLLASGSTVLALLGKGDGTFSSPIIASSLGGNWWGVGDFNGDGKVDLLLSPASGQVGVALGNGDGTFQSSLIITNIPGVGGSAAVVVMADLNADGHLDCVGILNSSGDAFVLLGKGDGSFKGSQIASGLQGVAVGEINGDARPDLVTVGSSVAQVYSGNGDGTFSPLESYFVQGSASVVLADFNGDGKIDVATSQPTTLLLGNGDGTFPGDFASPAISGLWSGVSADFNLDGNADIASLYTTSAGTYVQVALGDGTGKFPTVDSFPVVSYFQYYYATLATSDLNGDGKPDLVVLTNPSSWELYVMLGNGDGTFGSPALVAQGATNSFHTPASFVIQDFNGDHKPDLAVVDYSGTVTVLLGNGNGTFNSSAAFFAGAQANSMVAADFNNDGKMDILVGSGSPSGGGSGSGLLLGKGDGTFDPVMFVNPDITTVIASLDLNGDGAADLMGTSNGAGFPDGPTILLGNGDGTFRVLPDPFPATPGRTDVVSGATDLNRDGKPDLIGTGTVLSNAGNVIESGIEYLLGNGDGSFQTVVNLGFGGPFVVADVNGDKRPDIVMSVGKALVTLPNVLPATPDFLMTTSLVTPAFVAPGATATSTVKVTAFGGFNGDVTLSCGNLPAGTSCGFSPVSISGGASSTLSITTASSASAGSYPVVVVGTGPAAAHTAPLTLVVASSSGVTSAAVAPNSLVFGTQAVGTTSAPQAFALTNTGITQSMTVSTVTIQGQNAGDFAISGNTICPGYVLSPPTAVAPGNSCEFQLTFTPTGGGTRSASLVITDNATGSPQIVALSGTAPDFSMTPSSPTTVTVAAGRTATYKITLAPSAGFSQQVTLTCAGTPALATCTLSPSDVTLNGPSSTDITATIATVPNSTAMTTAPPPLSRWGAPVRPIFALALLMILPVLSLPRFVRPYRTRWLPTFPLLIVTAALVLLPSCGGSSSNSGGQKGTLPGTYNVTISGTTGSGSTSTTHVVNLMLVVQ